ncbi:uncharacterized protein CIMG_13013 [Coccidioides immitis RS]|uniref:Uncharacterized protein n=1 Tax=Coccidioides immitis (strain RS) TaxID=246410 RepID=A0A0D8JT24_COCIM|nr:uncharacterized protein CIMG_13013 [Coccidioides immitis RS]KJF60505.1 hypothetical protein CIMG_13013 [Coccidioides immitis RS]
MHAFIFVGCFGGHLKREGDGLRWPQPAAVASTLRNFEHSYDTGPLRESVCARDKRHCSGVGMFKEREMRIPDRPLPINSVVNYGGCISSLFNNMRVCCNVSHCWTFVAHRSGRISFEYASKRKSALDVIKVQTQRKIQTNQRPDRNHPASSERKFGI